MRPIDADALIKRIDRLKHRIAAPAAGFVDEDSYECGAIDALTDARNYALEAPTIGDWISVKDHLPEEKESMFAIFHDTELWSRAMWLKESETVLVGVAFPDRGQTVTVGKLHDGKWSTTVSRAIPHIVTHWMPMPPKPPKEDDGK